MILFCKILLSLLLIVDIFASHVFLQYDLKNQTNSSLNYSSINNFEDDSIKLLPLCIKVDLSPKAEVLIVGAKERISVSVDIDFSEEDFIKDNPFKNEFEEFSVFNVYSKVKKINYGEIVCFQDMKVSRKLYDNLLSKKIIAYVFCFSSQEVISENILLPINSLEIDMLKIVSDSVFTIKAKLKTEN